MIRQMCVVNLKHRKPSVALLLVWGIECVLDTVWTGRFRWFGQVERKDDTDWVKACQKIEIAGKRGRGRGKKTWSQCIDEGTMVKCAGCPGSVGVEEGYLG